ncbi:hypothetical protein ACN4EG_27335 [Alkalinema pantanalense CENA528]|uniref:hypothetical protein n=1 Tax=Alkalinema pantanalense TaxID=1620705 RepID=UPI003D6E7A90
MYDLRILNSITWQSSDQIQATITDLGVGLANIIYQLDNQAPQDWKGNNGQWSKSVSDLLNWNDPNQQGSHTLTFRSLDRAGNLQTEQYSFSVPKPFTWADSDLWTGSLDPNDPNTSGDNLVAPPLGGSGGQSGGSGLAQYGWVGGLMAIGATGMVDSGLAVPTPRQRGFSTIHSGSRPINPGSSNTYRSRLRSILTTAIAAIPTESVGNQAKKAALKNRLNLLIEAGAYLQGDADDQVGYGYEGGAVFTGAWLDQFFQGSLVKAKNTLANLNQIGLALAKELVTNPESVRLLTFQTLVETVVGAAHLQTNWFGAEHTNQIQQAARELARSYGLLKPQGTGLTGTFGWLDQLWDMADSGLSDGDTIRTILHGNTKAAGIVGDVVQMLNGLGNGDGDLYDLQLWRMSRSLVQAGMQVAQWRDAVQTVEFVEALLNLGYSLVQVHPTVDGTNGTEVANWVETLLEQGDIRIAAAGLSEFLSGIEPLPEKVKALKYADRLVKVADAVDDPTLDQQVLKAEFLSHLVNLGGAYAGLNPIGQAGDNSLNFFLDTSYRLNNLQLASQQLSSFLRPADHLNVVLYQQTDRLKALNKVTDVGLQGVKHNNVFIQKQLSVALNETAIASFNIKDYKGIKPQKSPLGLVSLQTFIDAVEKVEKAYKNDTPQQIITRIRQLYYPGSKDNLLKDIINDFRFDTLLPNAPNFEVVSRDPFYGDYPPSSVNEVKFRRIISEGLVGKETYAILTAKADENGTLDNPSPYLVIPERNEMIDIGHLLLTLDALLHPGSAAPFSAPYYQIPTIDPASWVADVGLGSVWLTKQLQGDPDKYAPANLKLSSTPTQEEIDAFYKASAPEADILGDIDGFGLFDRFNSITRAKQTLSQHLKEYYGLTSDSDPYTVRNRWRTFNGNQVTPIDATFPFNLENLTGTAKQSWIDRINRFNNLAGDGNIAAVTGQGRKSWIWNFTGAMFERFLGYAKEQLNKEKSF